MKKFQTIVLLIYACLCIITLPSLADQGKIDSFENVLKENGSSLPDTTRAFVLHNLAWNYKYKNLTKAFEYAEDCMNLATQLNDSIMIASTSNIIGILYKNRGDYDDALDYFMRGLKLHKAIRMPDGQIGNKNGIGICLDNIGDLYTKLGDYEKAIQYNTKALEIREEIKDRKGVAGSLNNIGIIYYYQGDIDKSIEYFEKSLAIKDELGDKEGISITLNNIGAIYFEKGDYDKAIVFYLRALRIDEELGSKHGIATRLNNLGEMYFSKGLEATKASDRATFYSKAVEYLENSIAVSREIDLKNVIKHASENLALVFEEQENYQEALVYYKLYSQIKDSLFNEDKSKEIGKLEAKHEFEIEEQESKRVEEAQIMKETLEKSRRDNLQYSGILIFLVLIFAGVFILGRFSIPVRLAEGMIFFSFLLFFEFTLVLLDPYIEEYSSGAPALKLGFNACLAALIFPLHSWFESKLKGKLIK